MIGTEVETVFGSIAETTCFLSHFRDLPDARQAGKVISPLNEVLLMALLGVLAGAESFTDIARFGERSWRCCVGFCRSLTARRRMILWAIFSPRSMPAGSSVASSIGWRR